MLFLFAHAGEDHSNAVESTVHVLPWYLQIVLLVIVSFGLYTILGLFIKKKDVVLLTLATIFLIAGFALYAVAPIVSVITITAGLFSTLVVTLTSLATPQETKGKK